MTTLVSRLLRLGRERYRARLRRPTVVFAWAAALAATLAGQEPIAHQATHLPDPGAVPVGGSPAGLWGGLSDPLTPHEAKLVAADGAAFDLFGSSVAISGDTAVIGAFSHNDLGSESGSAYVFERDPFDPADWNQTAKLLAADGAEFDRFGNSVAISGDTAVIGAVLDDDFGSESGSAYVFERSPLDPADWTQTAKLTAADGDQLDRFGSSVAIFGDTAVIGASDNEFGDEPGSAYVFERDPLDPAVWTQTAKLTATDGSPGDHFGVSVAISGDTAVIGAYMADAPVLNTGAVYIFERDPLDPAVWSQTAKLTAADGNQLDLFGWSVAISGDTAVIGAYGDYLLDRYTGSAYIFERDPLDPAVWTQTAKLVAADGTASDEFGFSVAISGDTAVIGALLDDDLGSGSGSAYVFEREPFDPADWNQTAKLLAADGTVSDEFGFSVAISGDTAVIGARLDDDLGSDSGSAYVYSLDGCKLALALQPLSLRAGEELRVGVAVDHRRPITVTVPFLLWVEDAAGRVVAQKRSPPVTMEPGDHRQLRLAVTLPLDLPAGEYRVLVGLDKMQQGIAGATRRFRVVE